MPSFSSAEANQATGDSAPPPDIKSRIDQVCEEFEQACSLGRQPPIEDYVQRLPSEARYWLIQELIVREVGYRRRARQKVDALEYFARFPDDRSAVVRVFGPSECMLELATDARRPDALGGDGGPMGEVSLQAFISDLMESESMDRQEIQQIVDSFPENARPSHGRQLAQELVRQKKLTSYQASLICRGKGKCLNLGNYRILDKLGQGGMGIVLKAEHRLMERYVAIKILYPQVVTDADAMARFRREVKTLARLDHPNIVSAFDCDVVNGTQFLVMEFVAGADLAKVVRGLGSLTVEQALDFALQAARALDYAHRHGVIHRDIKPSNLILDQLGHIKVLDMGLVRLETGSAVEPSLTSCGSPMGTADYMSPEQATQAHSADTRSDLYSLGATLFHLLTGRPPFADEAGWTAKILAHQRMPPPRVADFRKDVWPGVDDLVQQLLAKNPSHRPASAAAVVARLTELLKELQNPSQSDRTLPSTTPLAGPVQLIQRVSVEHFRQRANGGVAAGLLGVDTFDVRVGDTIRLSATLVVPSYCYWIALRPDGVQEICFPEDDNVCPERTSQPRYPSVSPGVAYGLTDGVGFQAFVLIASASPLPNYSNWRSTRGQCGWPVKTLAAVPEVARSDGTNVFVHTRSQPYGDPLAASSRGKGVPLPCAAPVALDIAQWFRSRLPHAEVEAWVFSVHEKLRENITE